MESVGSLSFAETINPAFSEVGARDIAARLSAGMAMSAFSVSACAAKQQAKATEVAVQCLNAVKW